jgi:replication factor C subunit 3/5
MREIPNIEKKLLPWSEKYRPNSISDVIYHEKITSTIIKYMKTNNLPHLLFYGPPGTGKTSTIVAIAKHYYKEDFDNMILILNASEERGIETVRNRIKQFVICKGLPERSETPAFKLIILDEIDAMTDDAQAILRKVIEKYVSNVRFCFICNYLKKINPAIQSRCVIFRFNPIPYDNMYDFIIKVCEHENIKITINAINLIIKKTYGDMRKLLNILQTINMHLSNLNDSNISKKNNNLKTIFNSDEDLLENNSIIINEAVVSKILYCPTKKYINNLLKFIQNNSIKDSHTYLINFVSKYGISLIELINYVYEFCMDYIINDNNKILNYPLDRVINIIKNISSINDNLTYCNNDNIQMISFLSIFYLG